MVNLLPVRAGSPYDHEVRQEDQENEKDNEQERL